MRPSPESSSRAFLYELARRVCFSFLDKGARHVQPAVGVTGLRFRDPAERVFGPFRSPWSSSPMPQSFQRSRSCFAATGSSAFPAPSSSVLDWLRQHHDGKLGDLAFDLPGDIRRYVFALGTNTPGCCDRRPGATRPAPVSAGLRTQTGCSSARTCGNSAGR